MRVHLVRQPLAGGGSLHAFLEQSANLPGITHFAGVVAWAKRSGLQYASPPLRRIASAGADTTLVIGIDQGGATRQGLELSRSLFNRVYVYHDETGRTFHPKVYLARSAAAALVFVGSNNLTEGGVHWNYETALLIELDLAATPDDVAWLGDLLGYVDALTADVTACKPLEDRLLRNARCRSPLSNFRMRIVRRPKI